MKKLFLFLAAICASVSASAATYQKVTSVSNLADGDVVVMVNEAAKKMSGAMASTGKYITAVDATINNGAIEATGVTEITLTASGSNWKLKVGTKTIGNNNNVDLNAEGKGTTTYSITFDAEGNAVIANTVATNGTFYFNAGSPRFKTYTSSSMAKVQLYKKVAGQVQPPVTDPDTTKTDSVTPPILPTGQMVTYNLLQRVEDLHAGDTVLFGTPAKDFVMGLYPGSGSNIKGVAATYSADRHQVTANNLNAYVVSVVNGKYAFRGSDGKFLYMYNTNKNLSSTATDTTSNKALWTVAIADDVATIKSAYSSSWTIYFNKTAATPMFCTYSAKDANMADVVLYSNNAPAYSEKELHPAFEVLHNGVAVGDTLDWGDVVYDDSWGTEAAPYSQLMSLTVRATDLSTPIQVSLSGHSAFSTTATTVPAKGGTLSVNFETRQAGSYTGTLTLTYDTIVKTIVLKAKAVREAVVLKPSITTTTVRVYMNAYFYNEDGLEERDIFYMSAKNLKKALYCKWENTAGFSIPSYTGEEMTVTLGSFGDVPYGSSRNLGRADIDSLEVTVFVKAFNPGMYTSQLHFYTYAEDGETIDAERRVELVVNMTTNQTPDPNPNHDPNPATMLTDVESTAAVAAKRLTQDGRVVIVRGGAMYDVLGRQLR